jgi:hypothetical protein
VYRTASTTFPVPASPFVRIIAAPSEIRLNASPRFRQLNNQTMEDIIKLSSLATEIE